MADNAVLVKDWLRIRVEGGCVISAGGHREKGSEGQRSEYQRTEFKRTGLKE